MCIRSKSRQAIIIRSFVSVKKRSNLPITSSKNEEKVLASDEKQRSATKNLSRVIAFHLNFLVFGKVTTHRSIHVLQRCLVSEYRTCRSRLLALLSGLQFSAPAADRSIDYHHIRANKADSEKCPRHSCGMWCWRLP